MKAFSRPMVLLCVAALLFLLVAPAQAQPQIPALASADAQVTLTKGQNVHDYRAATFSFLVRNAQTPGTGDSIQRVRMIHPPSVLPSALPGTAVNAMPPPGWTGGGTAGALADGRWYRDFYAYPSWRGIAPQAALVFEVGGWGQRSTATTGDWEVHVSSSADSSMTNASTAVVAPGGTLTTIIHPRRWPTGEAELLKGTDVSAGTSVEFAIRVKNTAPLPSEDSCAAESLVMAPCVVDRSLNWVALAFPSGQANVWLSQDEVVPPPGWTVQTAISGPQHYMIFSAPSGNNSPHCPDPALGVCDPMPSLAAIPPQGELTFEFTADVGPSCCGNTLVGDWRLKVGDTGASGNQVAAVAPGGTLTTTNHP